jgi:glutaredoxin
MRYASFLHDFFLAGIPLFVRKNVKNFSHACLGIFLSLALHSHVYATGIFSDEGICKQDSQSSEECEDLPLNPGKNPFPPITDIENKAKEPNTSSTPQKPAHSLSKKSSSDPENQLSPEINTIVYFFWGDGCPHCKVEKNFLSDIKDQHPSIIIKDFEVWYDNDNADLLRKAAEAYEIQSSGVPVTIIGEKVFVGFSEPIKEDIANTILECQVKQCVDPTLIISGTIPLKKLNTQLGHGLTSEKSNDIECKEKSKTVFIPWIGKLDTSEMSLPIMTLVIAGLDSFNPCAFFVLFSLLGILIHAHSRKKMLLTGGVFVFFSGFIYFLFMAAWLNLFLVMGQVSLITKIAGVIAVIIAGINIKDYFLFKKGVSLSIPDSAKPKLFDRMRKLIKSTSVVSILIGSAVLAIVANSYELLCTAGFPMVYTRILTLNDLSSTSYYFYLVFYNFIYVIPLLTIVIIFTITLGRKFLSERQGRILKLVSGTMMLGLGTILLLNPSLLNSALISFLLLIGAVIISTAIILLTRKTEYRGE